ncbi:MAG: VWA domain-containing protein [Candidatus Bipolaricaulia bacterium]
MSRNRIFLALVALLGVVLFFILYKVALSPSRSDLGRLSDSQLVEFRRLYNSLTSLREVVDKLSGRVERSEGMISALQVKLDGSSASITKLEERLISLLADLEDYRTELESLELVDLSPLEQRLSLIEAELRDLAHGLTGVEAAIRALEARMEGLEAQGAKIWECLSGMTVVLEERPEEVERLPVDLVLAIDSSGSMKVNDPGGLRITTAKRLIAGLDPARDRVGLVSWDNDLDFVQPLTSDLALVGKRLDQIDANGATNLNVGLSAAIAELLQNGREGAQAVIIFLTDGDGAYIFSREKGSPVAQAGAKGIKIYAIGLGKDPSSLKLQDMAGTTGGRFYLAPTAADLLGVYDELSRRLIAPARQVFKLVCLGDQD